MFLPFLIKYFSVYIFLFSVGFSAVPFDNKPDKPDNNQVNPGVNTTGSSVTTESNTYNENNLSKNITENKNTTKTQDARNDLKKENNMIVNTSSTKDSSNKTNLTNINNIPETQYKNSSSNMNNANNSNQGNNINQYRKDNIQQTAISNMTVADNAKPMSNLSNLGQNTSIYENVKNLSNSMRNDTALQKSNQNQNMALPVQKNLFATWVPHAAKIDSQNNGPAQELNNTNSNSSVKALENRFYNVIEDSNNTKNYPPGTNFKNGTRKHHYRRKWHVPKKNIGMKYNPDNISNTANNTNKIVIDVPKTASNVVIVHPDKDSTSIESLTTIGIYNNDTDPNYISEDDSYENRNISFQTVPDQVNRYFENEDNVILREQYYERPVYKHTNEEGYLEGGIRYANKYDIAIFDPSKDQENSEGRYILKAVLPESNEHSAQIINPPQKITEVQKSAMTLKEFVETPLKNAPEARFLNLEVRSEDDTPFKPSLPMDNNPETALYVGNKRLPVIPGIPVQNMGSNSDIQPGGSSNGDLSRVNYYHPEYTGENPAPSMTYWRPMVPVPV